MPSKRCFAVLLIVGYVCFTRACLDPNKCRGLPFQSDYRCYSVGEEWSYNKCTYYKCLYLNGFYYSVVSQNGCKVEGRCLQNRETWEENVEPGLCRKYTCVVIYDNLDVRTPSYMTAC